MARLLANDRSLPPGFRFHPTDEELFMFYLKRKVLGKSLRPQMISDVDVYRFAPWDLPSKACLKTRDLNWYFFCPRSKKFASGSRTNRSTEHGYWKSTGNDRTIKYNERPVGKIKTLIFHLGKAPNGDRTDWVMHEYRLEDQVLAKGGVPQDAYVICKVYKKSGVGPKNGEHYGAPFVEEEWESEDDDDNMLTDGGLVTEGDNQNASIVTGALHTSNDGAVATPSIQQQITSNLATQNVAAQLPPVDTAPPLPTVTEEDEIDRLLAIFTEDETLVNLPQETFKNDFFNDLDDLRECDGYLELDDLR